MIARIWHGWTTHQNAAPYEALLKNEIFPGIAAKNIDGYRKIQLLKRIHTDEVEFITIMWFDSIEHIVSFTGKDYETAYVPLAAQKVLKRYDVRSQHYELIEVLKY